jgi:prepilin peptidase dependent protein B
MLTKASKTAPKDIPKSLNFLNDDKSAFVSYCKSLYGDKLPLTVNNDSFTYFGSVDGARLYRMQSSIISCSHVQQAETIGGYVFYSDCRYYPSRVGLYIILDDNVYTLEEANSMGIINISDIYELYSEKMVSQYPGLESIMK